MSVVDQLKAAEGERLIDVEVFAHAPSEGTMLVRLTFGDGSIVDVVIGDR